MFKVFIAPEKREQVIYLNLSEVYKGGVVLKALNESGEYKSTILRIENDGTLFLHSSIDPSLGFALDSNGKIRITD